MSVHIHDRQGRAVPYYVELCPAGCVCIGFGVTTVHLAAADFRNVLRSMNLAAAALDQGCPEETPSPTTGGCH